MIMLCILLIFILASCKGDEDDDHSVDHEDDDHSVDHEDDDHSDDHEDDDHDHDHEDDDHSDDDHDHDHEDDDHDHDDDHSHDHDHEINTDPSSEEVRNAFLLSMFAGMSTVVGAASAFCLGIDDAKKERSTFLAGCLSFAAAVMLYVSFVEIWQEAIHKFEEGEDEQIAHIFTSLTFFSGIFLGFCTSKCVQRFQDRYPASKTSGIAKDQAVEMQSESKNAKEGEEPSVEIVSTPAVDVKKLELLKTGIVTAVSIAIHNFPEGLLTFFAAITDWELGVATAFAIAVHNIPEGISIAIPYYYASEERWKAFALAFVSGLAEPFGALIGWAILGDIWGDSVFAIMFGFTAGIMVYVSLSQLLPLARKNDPEDKVTTIMLYVGMFVMDLSLYVGGGHSH